MTPLQVPKPFADPRTSSTPTSGGAHPRTSLAAPSGNTADAAAGESGRARPPEAGDRGGRNSPRAGDGERRTPAGVELRGVSKRFGDVLAVANVDLDVGPGELLVLVGPSGCGKSTLLRIIAGLTEASEGEVRIGGERVDDLSPGDRDVAMVFQSYALYPHMTVEQNLGFGLRVRKTDRDVVQERVRKTARALGIDDLLKRRPGQLSGGQQQRVALGRAMVRDPGVFLFDEPLSNLDAGLRLRTRDEIAALHRRLGATMIFVTHDQVEALSLGQRVAILEGGSVQQIGSPREIYDRPANLFVAGFVGSPSVNLLSLRRAGSGTLEGGGFHFPGDWPFARATLAVRPEDLAMARGGSTHADFTTVVERVEALGSEQRLHVKGPAGEAWIIRERPAPAVASGNRIGVAVDWGRAHLFGPDGARVATGLRPGKAAVAGSALVRDGSSVDREAPVEDLGSSERYGSSER